MARPRHWPSHELGHFFGSGIVEAYRGAVNFYVRSLWQVPGRLDKQTLARLPAECTRLQSMQKAQALRQALTIVSSMCAAGRHLGLRSRAKTLREVRGIERSPAVRRCGVGIPRSCCHKATGVA